jgi:predicted ATP-grasp superfamily ATP-dependent carboligase
MKENVGGGAPRGVTVHAAHRSGDAVVPVLMFGTGITAIGVLRNLSRARVPVFTTVPDPNFVEKSRYHRRLLESAEQPPTPSSLREFLSTLSLSCAVLMPCSDDWALAIARLDGPLALQFPSCLPQPDTIETFTDKWRFAQMLEAHALPHPETALLSSMEALERMPDSSFANRFLKPLDSLTFSTRHKVKAFLIKDKASAVAVMRRGEDNGVTDFPIMLQDYVPGPPANHYFVDGFVDRNDRVRALFVRRRLRMFPPLLGNSTLMESVPPSEAEGAIDTIRRMFSALSYRGIFSAEFKRDERDGVFKILEVNARPWWYVEFAARSGVDVCTMAYRDALGLPIETPRPYRAGRRCVYLVNDFKAYPFNGPGSAVEWLRSWFGADETLFAFDDPWPGVAHFLGALRARLQKANAL